MVTSSAAGCAYRIRVTSGSVPPYCIQLMSDAAPYRRSVTLRSRSLTWNGSRAGSGTRSVTDFGPDASRTERTTPRGGGVPGASVTTSLALTHATASRDSCSRT